ncbi:MAG: hypothetical protein WDZ49_01625 [Litorilinea sp.]
MANDIWRTTLSSHLQTIQSHYYNITDSESWPVAGLLVLLDSHGHPVRSELHLYEDLPSHIQEAAVRQSRLVLQERYFGADSVPLRILHTAQMREAMQVRLTQAQPEARTSVRPMPWQGVVVAGIFVALVLVVWGSFSWLRPTNSTDTPASPSAGLDSSGEVANLAAVPAGETEGDTSVADIAAGDTPAGELTAPASVQAVEPGQLPASRNARADIQIGMRVQILPGFSLTLRSEAGARAGEAVGFLTEEQQVVVVGGPLLTQGETDTIVWWLVELDDGTQAWAAANTSQTTLLVPVE